MEEKRTLIETFLPVEEISAEAKKEKSGRAPIFEMHYWWTRKPLVTARAAVLGALLPADYDIQEFKKLLGLNRDKRAHTYSIPIDRIEQLKEDYKKTWGTIPRVLDPFAGGGSIPFEAQRLGVNTIANDYNPVAHLIERATLEYPQKYGHKLRGDVEKGLNWVYAETKKDLEQYYPKHDGKDVVAYIWAWMVTCPECGFRCPLVGQWWLCQKDKKKIFLNYEKPEGSDDTLRLEILEGNYPPDKNCSGGKGICLRCGALIKRDNVQSDIHTNETESLLAVVLSGKNGKEYDLPSDGDIKSYKSAQKVVKENWHSLIKQGLITIEEIPKDTRGSLSAQIYLHYWHKILNPRQLLLFATLVKSTQSYIKQLEGEHPKEYCDAIATYLTLIFGKHINFNCRSTVWYRAYEKIAPTTTFRGVPMMWDHAEVNPFVKGSGTLESIFGSILDGIEYASINLSNRGTVETKLGSITQLKEKVPLIVTDPPYFDDVRYAEFSTFFYSWERKTIENIIDLGDVPKAEEMSVGGWGRTKEFFNKLFLVSCKKMYETLTENGLVIMFFAHSSVEAWDFVINAMQKAGFRITATWPVHTESTANPLAQGKASIMSSIIIVARKRNSNRSGYIEEIQEELRDHIEKRLNEFWNYGLRGADLTVASMGATLDVITQYSDIKSYTGEMTIKDVLNLVQTNVARYVLNRYMNNASSLDTPTAFYLYARLSGLDGMPFDTANMIAKSMDIDLKALEKEGLVELKTAGKAKGVKLKSYQDREISTSQTFPMTSLINAVHYMMAAYAKGGYAEVESVLSSIPYGRNELKDILEAFQSLSPGDPERQTAQHILERMGAHFPRRGQQALDQF